MGAVLAEQAGGPRGRLPLTAGLSGSRESALSAGARYGPVDRFRGGKSPNCFGNSGLTHLLRAPRTIAAGFWGVTRKHMQ